MYDKVVFETPEEFFRACRRLRSKDDSSPIVPTTVTVVLDVDECFLIGEGSKRFELLDINEKAMVEGAFKVLGANVLPENEQYRIVVDDDEPRTKGS